MRRALSTSQKARFLMLAVLSTAAVPAEALPEKISPIDQCAKDSGLVEFRKALTDIAEREDTTALIGRIVPRDPANAAKRNDADEYVPAEEWAILRGVLRMGCTRSGEERVIPSVSAQLTGVPEQELKNKVLVLAGSKLFDEPYKEDSVSATLAWDVAEAVGTGGDFWTGVRLPDGREGWISDDNLYWLEPSMRYEIKLEKLSGKWMITEFWR